MKIKLQELLEIQQRRIDKMCLNRLRVSIVGSGQFPPPGGTAVLPEYIHYYGYYYQVIVQCLST
jgi:hypothetical protein